MPKVSVQDAVRIAKEFLRNADAEDAPQDVRLEEVSAEVIDSRQAWAITLGLFRKRSLTDVTPRGGLLGIGTYGLVEPQVAENRIYKTIYIDQESGEFIRMDIRKL